VTIDLHVHSSASDGTQTPAHVVAAAAASGLAVLALTDHDTTAGWAEAQAAARRHGIGLLPGIELSCAMDRVSVHMLAYLPDPADPELLTMMSRVRDDRITRLRRMVALISQDHDLSWDDVLASVGSTGGMVATVGRPHIADALIAKGVVRDRDEAFATVLNGRSRYYVPHYSPPALELVAAVVGAGGVPVIAHPRAEARGSSLSDSQLAELVGAGMAGLEVEHRDHSPSVRAELHELAGRLGVFTTGSSDYHGTGKRNLLAENVTAPEVLDRILSLGRGVEASLP
jgi:predicted metal-dependent phosphoesterase TrpH